ncbi:unnamed protein product [Rotaria sp. Silwood2]|nr:unnamed protein product [Rotaria sp. Silwood2]CAF2510035.1 unnamed protein product [Rotaria sp. Silwood2]CAF3849308.1 unnamed protein product [Rotaria sp. Silwood2]CAF4066670.1 unnamed protein product [Rotaria sp. Silwood2]
MCYDGWIVCDNTVIFAAASVVNMEIVCVHFRPFISIEHLTVWLELEIPSYSDSNDFCIVVQNEIFDEIALMKSNCIAYIFQIVDYCEQRAIVNKELFKRPQFDNNYHLMSNLDYELY